MRIKHSIFLAILAFILPVNSSGQSFSIGADFMSRYVWRGIDFGESLSIQPSLEFSAGSFAVGSWASYSVAADGSGANEHDLYLSVGVGSFTFGVTDYYFPGPGAVNFFDFSDEGSGAHWLEFNFGIGGTEEIPFTISTNIFFYNEPDNSVYIELGYPFTVEDVELSPSIGIVPQASGFYGTSSAGVISVGLTATKTVKVTESFELPISVMYIVNPTPGAERSFLVFGIGL